MAFTKTMPASSSSMPRALLVGVGGPELEPEAPGGGVGELDRLVEVRRPRSTTATGPKISSTPARISSVNAGEHGGPVEEAGAVDGSPPAVATAPLAERVVDLAGELVALGRRDEWARRRSPGPSDRRRPARPSLRRSARVNSSATVVDHDEALGRDAGLPVVLDPRGDGHAARSASRSAEAATMKGSEPPSSSTHFLSASPAAAATDWPAASEPVRVTAAIRGSPMTSATRSSRDEQVR